MSMTARLLAKSAARALTHSRTFASETAAATTTSTSAPVPATEKPKGALDRVGEVYIPTEAGNWRLVPADFKEFPERDTKNFPHPNILEFPSKVRMGVVPDSWFRFFYEKTGETGGYVFLGGMASALLSTELITMHDPFMVHLVPNAALLFVGFHLLGTPLARYLDETQEQNVYGPMRNFQKSQTEAYRNTIEWETKTQTDMAALDNFIFDAKRENVALQLEAEYRSRLATVADTVKRRLDFLAEYEATRRRFETQHMVDWIMRRVHDGVTPQLEQATLKQCVSDLNALASKA